MTNEQSTETVAGIDWDGAAGQTWVDLQALLDLTFKPIEDRLTDEAAAYAPARLLDIGCGAGATTLALARRLGTRTQCTGVDISTPLIDAARLRAEKDGVDARFLCTDAQDYDFTGEPIDMIVSRFGVMFFTDPAAAFRNLLRAMRPGGNMILIAWRSPDQNPFMTAAARAAGPLLPLPEYRPDEPGQFGFADKEYVQGILEAAGWTAPRLDPVDFKCVFPVAQLDTYVMEMGSLGRALKDAGQDDRAKVLAAVRPAFDSYIAGEDVRFTASCWIITARAPLTADDRSGTAA